MLLDPADLAKLGNLSLMARIAVEGFVSGLHRSILHGYGSEFHQYRNYSPGDDPKYLDWKVYARREKLYTKVFEEETNMNCSIVIDVSQSMDYAGEKAVCTKLKYAAMIAAAIAYLANRQGDSVGLTIFSESIQDHLPPGNRKLQLQRIFHHLSRIEASGTARPDMLINYLESHIRNRGIVIYLSDMLESEDSLPPLISKLRARNCDCLALQILDQDEVNLPAKSSARFVGSESNEEILTSPAAIAESYNESMAKYLKILQSNFLKNRVDYLRLETNESLGLALARYLHHRESLR